MSAALVVMVMTSSFFNPGFALSSHFDTDGAPLSELSWSSSLAVVAVSFSGLFTFIFLMLACLCCKKGDIGFKEFENAEGEEYQADVSTLASPATQTGPEVYILPLTQVSRPLNKQPGRSVQLLKSSDVGRHSLLYIKEIGHGWFGKVLLGEVNCGVSTMQVVVKELKASASVQDQMHFLEEAKPFRGPQHPALLQCLAQCTEVTPYLLVMEFCPLGDVKGYLRSCRAADTMTPDPLILQRMACEVASGLLHLHKHNIIHSDLALRNCLLTSDVTVKIGDYGLSHSKYKDDYFVTPDQTWVPVRWIAPELVDEVHGNLLVADQNKQSNIWSLGVTIWELFELGTQPYRLYSDRQVLNYTVKDQQLKLPKPLLTIPLAERWYEVMQFCWLQADQRPNAEEVHLLLNYLCAKCASEAEEDFERRWTSMRPNTGHHSLHGAGALSLEMAPSASSSFPLLEQFSVGDNYHSESGDDVLTVTETSHGLNFEYKWEQARAEQSYHHSSSTGTLGQGNPHCQEIYYPPGGIVGGCGMDGLTLGVTPSYYEPKQLHAPGTVPVLSAHSPSVSSEYYIRIEEPMDCNVDIDYTMSSYSPEFGGSNGSFLTGSGDSRECMTCPAEVKPIDSYWAADVHKSSAYDSDNTSPALSLTMEPLLGQVSNDSPLGRPWESGHYVSYKDRDGGYYYEHSPPITMDGYIIGKPPEPLQESWGSRSLRRALRELENPLGIPPSLDSPRHGYSADPYLETSQGSIIGKNVTGGYYDMMGSLRKTMPNSHQVSIDIESEGALFLRHRDSDSEEEDDEEDMFVERQAHGWSSHPNSNSASLCRRQGSCRRQDAYMDFHYTMPTTDVEDCWSDEQKLAYHHPPKPIDYLEATAKDSGCVAHGGHHPLLTAECNPYIYICHETAPDKVLPVECCQVVESPHFIDPLTGAVVRNCYINDYEKIIGAPSEGKKENKELSADLTSKANKSTQYDLTEQYVEITVEDSSSKKEESAKEEIAPNESKPVEITPSQITEQSPATVIQSEESPATVIQSEQSPATVIQSEPNSELSRTADSGIDRGHSSVSLVEIDDCSDDDITDVTSAIFGEFPVDYVEAGDYNTSSPALKSLQKQVGTPDSMDSIDLPSTTGSSEAFSPASHPSSSPKAMDSGYDTENNESPEFVLKEPHESQEPKAFVQPLGKPIISASLDEEKEDPEAEATSASLPASQSSEGGLTALSQDNPYRDSAYFSDYDAENEKLARDEEEEKGKKEECETQQVEVIEELKVNPSEEHEKKEEEKVHASQEESEDNDPIKNESLLPQLEIIDTEDKISASTPCSTTPAHSAEEGQMKAEKECFPDEVLETETEVLGETVASEQAADQEGLTSTQTLSCDEVSRETGHTEIPEVPSTPLDSNETNSATESNSNIKLEEYEEEREHEEAEVSNVASLVKLPEEHEQEDSGSPDTSSKKNQTPQTGQEQGEEVHSKISTRASSPPPPHSPLEGRVSPADGEEADEEDADSDDSDESDEELRTYSVQEQSEESEDENHPIPIVISDCSDAHNLRSLLKMTTLVTESSIDEPEAKKKVVSFFDDVTVYLFDQESPTRELADQGFPPGAESSKKGPRGAEPHSQEKVNASDDSSDGNMSEESAGFEWEDDFPLLPIGTSAIKPAPEPKPAPPKLPPVTAETKPTIQYSRFTVSPSIISRFSITHVTDSDMESAGGSSEDGDKE
ncbi:serine/threonine-protein kinase LMTK1 isoform X1 [Clupea harengus]|uniref:non-specific serine/threonine protein kinase n=2 Tax=Clupea harengus TaxID=7950 RepID=A0A6P8EME2_CLUHA|nr:serine/threonine-protein kinase LMTK1 isoform X1 [Clupea harengus]